MVVYPPKSSIPPPFAIRVAASGTTYTWKSSSLSFSLRNAIPEVLPAQGPPVKQTLMILCFSSSTIALGRTVVSSTRLITELFFALLGSNEDFLVDLDCYYSS